MAKKLGMPLAEGVGAVTGVGAGSAGLEKKLGTEVEGGGPGLVAVAEGALPNDAGKGNEGVAGLE